MAIKIKIRCPKRKQVLGTLFINQKKGKNLMDPLYLRFMCPSCEKKHERQKMHWVDWRGKIPEIYDGDLAK
jgi:hypothetical protein